MSKPKQFTYEKKAPFRDASFFIIICEGESREPEYFKFFDGISSRVKVVPVANVKGHSSPLHLIENASQTEKELEVDSSIDTLWFVIGTDKWSKQIHELPEECNKHPHWQIVQSNPCFDV